MERKLPKGDVVEVVKKETSKGTYVFLSGTVDESSGFGKKVGEVTGLLEVNCKGIVRINSSGVKLWVQFFSRLRKNGAQLKFHECSVAFMQQFGFFQNFVVPQEVVSLFVPFFCKKCSKAEDQLFVMTKLKAAGFSVSPVPCACGGLLALDDSDDFFQTLKR